MKPLSFLCFILEFYQDCYCTACEEVKLICLNYISMQISSFKGEPLKRDTHVSPMYLKHILTVFHLNESGGRG